MPQGGSHEQHVKAGQQSHKDGESDRQPQQRADDENNNRRGGSGNFAEDRERASEAGRKGGQR